jgi:hypothetical protein
VKKSKSSGPRIPEAAIPHLRELARIYAGKKLRSEPLPEPARKFLKAFGALPGFEFPDHVRCSGCGEEWLLFRDEENGAVRFENDRWTCLRGHGPAKHETITV